MSAVLVLSTLDMKARTVDATVEFTVQGPTYPITMQFTTQAVEQQAITAGRDADNWRMVDVATLCSQAMGVPVGFIAPPEA